MTTPSLWGKVRKGVISILENANEKRVINESETRRFDISDLTLDCPFSFSLSSFLLPSSFSFLSPPALTRLLVEMHSGMVVAFAAHARSKKAAPARRAPSTSVSGGSSGGKAGGGGGGGIGSGGVPKGIGSPAKSASGGGGGGLQSPVRNPSTSGSGQLVADAVAKTSRRKRMT